MKYEFHSEETRLKRYKNLAGMTFGKWYVIERTNKPKGVKARTVYWLCRCVCGKEKPVQGHVLLNGHSRSCGCSFHHINPPPPPMNKKPRGKSCLQSAFNVYKQGALRRNKTFDLSIDQFEYITQQDCYYCGSKPSNVLRKDRANGTYIYNGIDRIDNTKGYDFDNCVPCCKKCNVMKLNHSFDDFISHIRKILDHTKIMFIKQKTA